MQRKDHSLLSPSLGSFKTLTSFHFGKANPAGAGKKIYIQASLHAEELPGMLAAHHLLRLLEAADAQNAIQGEIIVVPVANPIGLAQRLDHRSMGRFELGTSENFNRNFPDLATAVLPAVRGKLGPNPADNTRLIRTAAAEYLAQWQPQTELESQRKILTSLAFDADVVLDLHCDFEAAVHLYTETPCWPVIEPLGHLLQAKAVLLALDSGGLSFDEAMSGPWWRLAKALADEVPAGAIPQACASVTVELRGEADVTHELAQADAKALFGYLQHLGMVAGTPPALPAAACEATPLAGSQTVNAPVPGVVAFAAQPGQHLRVGDLVAEIIDPIQNTVYAARAEVDGVLFARICKRYVTAGEKLGNIAGKTPFRTGNLLGA
jgi:predicted deacylase